LKNKNYETIKDFLSFDDFIENSYTKLVYYQLKAENFQKENNSVNANYFASYVTK
jgi:hypothetical protein